MVLTPVEAEPPHIVLDGIGVLDVFLGRIGIVEAEVAAPAVLIGDAEVEADRLGMPDVQVAVWLGRKPGDDGAKPAAAEVVLDDLPDEVTRPGGSFGGHDRDYTNEEGRSFLGGRRLGILEPAHGLSFEWGAIAPRLRSEARAASATRPALA